MTTQTIFELIGYLGSLLVIVSMLMSSVVKLRIINSIGSVIFAAYALLIHSYPTAILQLFLIIINVVNLYKLLAVKKEYSIVNLPGDDLFANHFIEQNISDIKKFFPEFTSPSSQEKIYLISCNSTCAGILIYSQDSDSNAIQVKLDYSTPAFRDTSVGTFLYKYLSEQNIKVLKVSVADKASNSFSREHEKYLKRMGFVKNQNEFVKILKNDV